MCVCNDKFVLIFISLRKMNLSDLAVRLTCNSGKYDFCKPVPNVMVALKVCTFHVAWSGGKLSWNKIVQHFISIKVGR